MQCEQPCADDLLTTFLLGMQTLEHAEDWSPFLPAALNDAAKRASSAVAVDRRRLAPREQLQALRDEVNKLSQQLRQLHETQQLQRSLDRLLNEPEAADAISWKECATWERHAKDHAEDTKTELLRRISVNMELLENVKRLLVSTKIKGWISSVPTVCMSFVPTGDDAQLYQTLRSGLDYRCSQLDAILQQCVASTDSVEMRDTCIHADGRGIDLRELGVKPFDLRTISSTLARYFNEHSHFRWHGENEEVYLKRTVAASELNSISIGIASVRSHTVLRRFAHQNQFVMVWEAATEWDNDSDAAGPRTTRLWQQGWMVIRPFEELGSDVSLAQAGVSTQIHSSDGSDLLVLDPQMTGILQSLDAFGKKQVQIVDNMLMDAHVKL